MSDPYYAEASRLVSREGWLLDQKRWDDWLELYLPEAEYWLPCFLEDGSVTSDPQKQVSLIYYASRAGLEDRVFRIRTDQSLASKPLPRTSHLVNVGDVTVQDDGTVLVESSWAAFSYRLEQEFHFFGTQTHVLKPTDAGLRIAKRHVMLLNDKIPCPLDIYSV